MNSVLGCEIRRVKKSSDKHLFGCNNPVFYLFRHNRRFVYFLCCISCVHLDIYSENEFISFGYLITNNRLYFLKEEI